MNKKDFTRITLMVCLSLAWYLIGYTAHKEPKVVTQTKDYIATYNCETEDIMVIDGVEKVRYLCNAESNSNDDV